MRLISVYQHKGAAYILWRILKERTPETNISHKGMPSWERHIAFIESKPYHAWHFLIHDDEIVGSAYLSKHNEIGVFIFKDHHGRGFGKKAIALIMGLYPRKHYLANINPKNEKSIKLFEGLGFHHIQNTYEIEGPR